MNPNNCPEIELIPATKRSVRNYREIREEKKLRVAAYCRVSTENEEQQTSYTKQKDYYTSLIKSRENWDFVGIYADEGISGTSTKHRTGFNRMMSDAKEGKIDYIITKSVSRFARNTVDTLRCIQELRLLPSPVMVYFEKENLNSFDMSSDFVLTVLSALAQAESRSISENVRWSLQKNFQSGKPTVNLNRMIGYDAGKNGEWLINEQQAETVRKIYQMYLCGISAHEIARILNENTLYTVNGKKWFAQTVLSVLRNEKFVGDLAMQKTITVDMLSHKSKKNESLAPKYYIADHHAAIIDRNTWNKVQSMLTKNSQKQKQPNGNNRMAVFSDLVCGICGSHLKREKYSSRIHRFSNDETNCFCSYPLWKCVQNCKTDSTVKKLKKHEKRCQSEYLHECAVEQSFMETVYQMKYDIAHNMEQSEVIKEYYHSCIGKAAKENALSYHDYQEILSRIDEVKAVLEQTIHHQKELSDRMGENDILDELINEYEKQLTELEKQKDLKIGQIINANETKPLFDYFVQSVMSLPDTQNIHNVNISDHNTKSISTFFKFDKAFYRIFIESGTVYGDMIEYKTKFGITFRTAGNTRKAKDFIGFVKSDETGTPTIITEIHQVVGTKLQYRPKVGTAGVNSRSRSLHSL